MNNRYSPYPDADDSDLFLDDDMDDDFDDDLWDDIDAAPASPVREQPRRNSRWADDRQPYDPSFDDDNSFWDDDDDDYVPSTGRIPAPARPAREPVSSASGEKSWNSSPSLLFTENDSGRRLLSLPVLILLDCVLIGCSLLVFALFHHVIPRSGTPVSSFVPTLSSSDFPDYFRPLPTVSDSTVSGADASAPADDRPFTDEVIVTDTSYHSSNVVVTVTTHKEDRLIYHVQDIYVRSPEFFRTAFAKDTYGVWVTEETPEIARRNNAICAINGDYYGASSTKGLVIRNGVFYRGNGNDTDDILVLLADGSMEVYTPQTYNEEALLKKNVWQTWSFGPSLLNADGSAIEHFDSEIADINPRSAVGYYEPGHYCFISVEGRSDDSKGLTLADLAKLCQSMGCKIAYNLDGGKTSMMIFEDRLVNDAYHGGRECSDILYICDPLAE